MRTSEYFFVRIFFKQTALKLWDQIYQKGILGTNFKKKIVEFKISKLEYPFVLCFNLNKTLSTFKTKFAKKNCLSTKFRKRKNLITLFWVIVKRFTKF